RRLVQPPPQVRVLHRRLPRGPPPVPLPPVHPPGDPVPHIRAVGVQHHRNPPGQTLQRDDRRGQLHPVVGGLRLTPVQLLLVRPPPQQHTPTTRPRIPLARPIGIDLHPARITLERHARQPTGPRALRTPAAGPGDGADASRGRLRRHRPRPAP